MHLINNDVLSIEIVSKRCMFGECVSKIIHAFGIVLFSAVESRSGS